MKILDILRNKNYKESKIVLSYIKNVNYSVLNTMLNTELTEDEFKKFIHIQNKLIDNYPLQYAIGKWNFYGYDFIVTEDTLIPRPETEILVEEILKNNLNEKKILDIGCGTGAISITLDLETRKRGLKIYIEAVDISEKALEITRKNIDNLDARVRAYKSDLFENVSEKFDIIVSNPPYISEKDYENLEKELYYEPKTALVGGVKGYEIYEKIIKNIKKFLNEDGTVYFEIGYDQAFKVSELFKKNGFLSVRVMKDYNKIDRIVIAKI